MSDILDHFRRAIAAVKSCSGRSYDETLDYLETAEHEFAILRSMQHLLADLVVTDDEKAELFHLIAELQAACDELPEHVRIVIRQAERD